MLSKKVADLINTQVNKELYSAYLYYDFSLYYEEEGLKGFSNWYEVQAKEEMDHALMMVKYLQENSVRPVLQAIDKPDKEFSDHMAPLKAGLEHEIYVTSLIHDIYAAAQEEKDFRTMQFLDWFVKEQGEEESTADDLIKKMELFGGDAKSLYMLDSELAARVYTPATQE